MEGRQTERWRGRGNKVSEGRERGERGGMRKGGKNLEIKLWGVIKMELTKRRVQMKRWRGSLVSLMFRQGTIGLLQGEGDSEKENRCLEGIKEHPNSEV